MDLVYRGWVGGRLGVEADGKLKAGYIICWSHCVYIEIHQQPQFTCQTNMVTDSSLTPSVALLVCPNSTVLSIVGCHEFIGSQN